MKKEWIIELLKDYKKEDAEKFANYCIRLLLEPDKRNWWKKNWFMQTKTDEDMAQLFRRVHSEWLVFDWVHITLQSTGISYDYIAYKNKMLIAYPDTIIDINLVYKDDEVSFSKESWKVIYKHNLKNPFGNKVQDIAWGYCVIKNKRWEFLTILTKDEFEKHKTKAKTSYIWNEWYAEMCMKTLVKKAVKIHYNDIYANMEEEDNKQYDLSQKPKWGNLQELANWFTNHKEQWTT